MTDAEYTQLREALDRFDKSAARWDGGTKIVTPEQQFLADCVTQDLDNLLRKLRHILADQDAEVELYPGIDDDTAYMVRQALEGDSNDAEHDALVQVAAEFGIDYADDTDCAEGGD